MGRARTILLVVGICVAAIGLMALPFPITNPKVFTESLFHAVTTTGALVRPGLILFLVGLGCLAVAALLPSDRE